MPEGSYLQGLNAEQRKPVEHGVAGNGANIAGSLLVIAGAGSGKTNTLAHRVAHLIVNGTDPVGELEAAYHQRKGAHLLRHHLSGERVGRGHPRPHAGDPPARRL